MWVEEKRGEGASYTLRPAVYGVCTTSLFTFKCNYFFHKSCLWPITDIAAHITPAAEGGLLSDGHWSKVGTALLPFKSI